MSDALLRHAKIIFGEDIVRDVSGNATISGSSIDVSVPPHKTMGEYRDGELIIHFVNGKSVRFRTSEWGWIDPVDKV